MPACENPENVDRQLGRGLLDFVGDKRSLLERRHAHSWAHIITGLAFDGKREESIDVVQERLDHLPSDIGARTFDKPSIQVV